MSPPSRSEDIAGYDPAQDPYILLSGEYVAYWMAEAFRARPQD